MLDRLKSLPLTIFLTILIWMYAESQVRLETNQVEQLRVRVSFHAAPEITSAALSPSLVTLSIPSETLQAIGGTDKIRVIAVPEVDLNTLAPGTTETVAVKFVPEYSGAMDERITVQPEAGQLTVTAAKKP